MSDWKNVQYKDGKMRTSEGGGGGGSSTFAGLDDVSFNNLQNGQVPKYNSTTQKWENANESGGGGTVTDVQVDGTSVVNQQGVAEITMPTPPSVPDELSDLSDVQFSNLTDHQPLRYNATSQKWVNGADSYPPLIYSDEEREVGVWRDGKPLYQKTWEFSGYVDPGTKSWNNILDVSSLNISKLVICDVMDQEGCYHTGYLTRIQNGYLQVYDFEAWPFKYVTLRYTKSTDTPGSGTWTTQGGYAHHYSTTEHVIGTWIDGKPIYERSFSKTLSGSPDTGDSFIITTGITNIDSLIKMEGSIKAANTYAFCSETGLIPTIGWNYSFHINPTGQLVAWVSNNQAFYNQIVGGKAIVTIRYTKTTD